MNQHRGTKYHSAPYAKDAGAGVIYLAGSFLLLVNLRSVAARTTARGQHERRRRISCCTDAQRCPRNVPEQQWLRSFATWTLTYYVATIAVRHTIRAKPFRLRSRRPHLREQP